MKIKLILFILLLFTSRSFSQNIEGTFSTSYGEGTRTLSFKKHGFKDEISQSVGNDYGEGSYKVRHNQLHLIYKKIPNPEISTFSIVPGAKITDSTRIFLSASDDAGTAVNATLTIIDKDQKIKKQYLVDKSGKGDFIFKNDNQALYLLIACPGYYTVQIPISKLENRSSAISVKFKLKKFSYVEPHIRVYHIKKLTVKELILSSTNEKEIRFERIKE